MQSIEASFEIFKNWMDQKFGDSIFQYFAGLSANLIWVDYVQKLQIAKLKESLAIFQEFHVFVEVVVLVAFVLYFRLSDHNGVVFGIVLDILCVGKEVIVWKSTLLTLAVVNFQSILMVVAWLNILLLARR